MHRVDWVDGIHGLHGQHGKHGVHWSKGVFWYARRVGPDRPDRINRVYGMHWTHGRTRYDGFYRPDRI